MDNWWVYIVEKKTGLYVGVTTDLQNRMRQHGQPAPLYYEGPISKSDHEVVGAYPSIRTLSTQFKTYYTLYKTFTNSWFSPVGPLFIHTVVYGVLEQANSFLCALLFSHLFR